MIDKNMICSLLEYLMSNYYGREYKCYQDKINLGYHYCTMLYITDDINSAKKEIKDKLGIYERKIFNNEKEVNDFFLSESRYYYLIDYIIDTFIYKNIENINIDNIKIDMPYVKLFINYLQNNKDKERQMVLNKVKYKHD